MNGKTHSKLDMSLDQIIGGKSKEPITIYGDENKEKTNPFPLQKLAANCGKKIRKSTDLRNFLGNSNNSNGNKPDLRFNIQNTNNQSAKISRVKSLVARRKQVPKNANNMRARGYTRNGNSQNNVSLSDAAILIHESFAGLNRLVNTILVSNESLQHLNSAPIQRRQSFQKNLYNDNCNYASDNFSRNRIQSSIHPCYTHSGSDYQNYHIQDAHQSFHTKNSNDYVNVIQRRNSFTNSNKISISTTPHLFSSQSELQSNLCSNQNNLRSNSNESQKNIFSNQNDTQNDFCSNQNGTLNNLNSSNESQNNIFSNHNNSCCKNFYSNLPYYTNKRNVNSTILDQSKKTSLNDTLSNDLTESTQTTNIPKTTYKHSGYGVLLEHGQNSVINISDIIVFIVFNCIYHIRSFWIPLGHLLMLNGLTIRRLLFSLKMNKMLKLVFVNTIKSSLMELL